MKRISLLILASLLLFSCGGTPLRPVEAFIDETRQAVCPDRRVNIFDVDYERKGKTVTLSGEMNSAAGMKDLVAALEAEGYAVVNDIALLPSPELKGKKYGVVNRSVANMRVEPSARAEMATQAVLGTPLRVYKKQRGQYYVQTPDGYLGWMEEDAFVHLTAAEFNSWIISERIIFTDDAGFIYSYPSTASERLGDITASSILRAVDVKEGFVKIAYPDGRTGFIERSACEHLEFWSYRAKPKADTIISMAKSYMGRSYLWGGTSTKMMDCSGFVRIVMLMHGIYLPRDASQQVLVGKTVAEGKDEIDKIKPGDLVFFGAYREDGSERITHVGLYLGNRQFIHETGVVMINSFDPEDENFSEYRLNQFIRAKDVINHVGKLGVQHILDNPMIFVPMK